MKSLVTCLLVAFAASEQRKPAASCFCSVETSTASIWMQILRIRTWTAASWVTVPFEPSWDVPPSCSNRASPPSPSCRDLKEDTAMRDSHEAQCSARHLWKQHRNRKGWGRAELPRLMQYGSRKTVSFRANVGSLRLEVCCKCGPSINTFRNTEAFGFLPFSASLVLYFPFQRKGRYWRFPNSIS